MLGTVIRKTKISLLHRWLLGRKPDKQALSDFAESEPAEIAWKLLLSKEGLDNLCQLSFKLHSHLIHNARLKLVRTYLPQGDIIFDLGGAFAPLYRMGYPHKFNKLVLIDLPTEKRHQEFRRASLECTSEAGQIEILYGDMTELAGVEDNSVDFVWAGQVIEHVSREAGERMCHHVFRVLRKGGSFCLDTPNGLITSIHAATAGLKLIHLDHKIEYRPADLREMLKNVGFTLLLEKGVCHMPNTVRTGQFSYEDFIVGSPIVDDADSSYIQYHHCTKPEWAGYKATACMIHRALE
jgi:predicted SAM-dependent methyltransferase